MDMISGIGIDLVEITRIKSVLRKESLVRRLFGPTEIKYCSRKERSAESFAVRFAAKEAFLKAIGVGWGTRQSPKWSEIEVLNHPRSSRPAFKLSGKARLLLRQLGISQIHLSLAHTKHYAMALVILEMP